MWFYSNLRVQGCFGLIHIPTESIIDWHVLILDPWVMDSRENRASLDWLENCELYYEITKRLFLNINTSNWMIFWTPCMILIESLSILMSLHQYNLPLWDLTIFLTCMNGIKIIECKFLLRQENTNSLMEKLSSVPLKCTLFIMHHDWRF